MCGKAGGREREEEHVVNFTYLLRFNSKVIAEDVIGKPLSFGFQIKADLLALLTNWIFCTLW